jgi:hypothetical protein
MHTMIRAIERPGCPCGGSTHLERIESHPIHGKGFEVRVFACEYCGKEITTETTPADIEIAPMLAGRGAILSVLMGKLRSVSRFARSRGRPASPERPSPAAHK